MSQTTITKKRLEAYAYMEQRVEYFRDVYQGDDRDTLLAKAETAFADFKDNTFNKIYTT